MNMFETGVRYEDSVSEYLTEHKIQHESQVTIGKKRSGGKHRVDIVVGNVLVSLKHQEVNGTAEEKIPYEFLKLQDAVEDYGYDRAIIVLSGPKKMNRGEQGWTLKDYYLSDTFKDKFKEICPKVTIMSHEEFINYVIQ